MVNVIRTTNLAHRLRAWTWNYTARYHSSSKARNPCSADLHLEAGQNAYEILGVPATCSQECIRDAFRKLAKLTHPDMQSDVGTASSAQFILVLSAYKILSNPEIRAKYNAYLQACSKAGGMRSQMRPIKENRDVDVVFANDDTDVVEWLRWYRNIAKRMLQHEQLEPSSGFYSELKASMHEALRECYFGPRLDYFLPNCFEAEERALATELEVLQLVSGRYLFGTVVQVHQKALDSSSKPVMLGHSQLSQGCKSSFVRNNSTLSENEVTSVQAGGNPSDRTITLTDIDRNGFVELELYLHGKRVARAMRKLSKSDDGSVVHDHRTDEISVYLCHDQFPQNNEHRSAKNLPDLFLGTIVGLNMMGKGGKGRVYSFKGEQTHIIWLFRTPWVKHMHWFQINGKKMLCECRSTRARLPPSKFWIFEARSQKHNIGGWYIETLWRNPVVEETDPSDWAGKRFGLLHPAMYIFGTAYTTLDSEVVDRQKKSIWSKVWEKQKEIIAAASKVLQQYKINFPSI